MKPRIPAPSTPAGRVPSRRARRARLALRSLLSLLPLLALAGLPPMARGWGAGHRPITRAAVEVLPEALRAEWAKTHVHPVSGEQRTVASWLVERFSMHPDWVDGPSGTGKDIDERRRVTQFVYAERNGVYFPPIAWADPDRDPGAARPWTYHYFTRPTEEVNRAFAEAGARWYFERMAAAFRRDQFVAAAEYGGAFAHAIEDRVSPYHVWDGYQAEREALEESLAEHGLQSPEGSFKGEPKGPSLFWGLDGPNLTADLSGYAPQALGTTVDGAAEAFTRRLFETRAFARSVYSRREGFLAAHLADDWRAKGGSPGTDRYLSEIATHNARLVADVFLTAWLLAGGGK